MKNLTSGLCAGAVALLCSQPVHAAMPCESLSTLQLPDTTITMAQTVPPVHPYNMGGGYVNFMFDDEADGRLQAAYGDNYARLAAAKTKYDPTNLFRVNQNIAPAAEV